MVREGPCAVRRGARAGRTSAADDDASAAPSAASPARSCRRRAGRDSTNSPRPLAPKRGDWSTPSTDPDATGQGDRRPRRRAEARRAPLSGCPPVPTAVQRARSITSTTSRPHDGDGRPAPPWRRCVKPSRWRGASSSQRLARRRRGRRRPADQADGPDACSLTAAAIGAADDAGLLISPAASPRRSGSTTGPGSVVAGRASKLDAAPADAGELDVDARSTATGDSRLRGRRSDSDGGGVRQRRTGGPTSPSRAFTGRCNLGRCGPSVGGP